MEMFSEALLIRRTPFCIVEISYLYSNMLSKNASFNWSQKSKDCQKDRKLKKHRSLCNAITFRMIKEGVTASRIHWLLETNGCNLDEVFSYIIFLTKEIAILNNRFPCLLLFIVNNILYKLQITTCCLGLHL